MYIYHVISLRITKFIFEEVKQLINSGKKQRGPLKIRLRLELFLPIILDFFTIHY